MANTQSQAARVAKEIEARGYTLTRTGAGHYKFTHPCGQALTLSNNPSDTRWERHIRTKLKRLEQQHGMPARPTEKRKLEPKSERMLECVILNGVEYGPEDFNQPLPIFNSKKEYTPMNTPTLATPSKPQSDLGNKLNEALTQQITALTTPPAPKKKTRHSTKDDRADAIKLLANGLGFDKTNEAANFGNEWIQQVLGRAYASQNRTPDALRQALEAGWLKPEECIKVVEGYVERMARQRQQKAQAMAGDLLTILPRLDAIEAFLVKLDMGFTPPAPEEPDVFEGAEE